MKNNIRKKTGYASIDRPWLQYYRQDAEKTDVPKESIYMRLERCNINRLDNPAIELRSGINNYKNGLTITYRQYLNIIRECARGLYVLGVKKNEIMPIILPNIPESRIFIYALNYIGATAYPVSPMVSTEILKGIIDENKAKDIIVFSGFWDKFKDTFSSSSLNNVIYISGEEYLNIETVDKESYVIAPQLNDQINVLSWKKLMSLTDSYSEKLVPVYENGHIAVIIGTSGTTGTSKGVCMSDYCLNSLALEQEIADIFRPGEVFMDALISSIGYGISMEHSSGCCGAYSILIPELITDDFPKLLYLIKPDIFAGGPIHYINLVRSKEYKSRELPEVRNLISGGSSLNIELERMLNKKDYGYKEKEDDYIVVRQGYGATECCGSATYEVKGAYKFGGIGIPLPLENMGIFKPGTDIELPYGEEGEICISGPTIMSGYLNNKEETENVLKLHSDGNVWLHLADLGYCDEDGQFYITDRIKNIFMRMGFNVHPSKIAEFINRQNGVEECCVIGIKHPTEENVPVAFVVKEKSIKMSNDTLKEKLIETCKNNLNELDIPYEWHFVESIPRNMGGKMDINKLIKEYEIKYV